jgi:hypothetical protein
MDPPPLTLGLAQRTSQHVLAELESQYHHNGQALVQFARNNHHTRPSGEWRIIIPFRLNDGTIDEGLRVHVAPRPLLLLDSSDSERPADSYVLGIELLDFYDVLNLKPPHHPQRLSTRGPWERGLSVHIHHAASKLKRVGESCFLRYNATVFARASPDYLGPIKFCGDFDGERLTLFMTPPDAQDRLKDFIDHLVAVLRPLPLPL